MYKSLAEAISDLEKTGQLLRIPFEVDGDLEAAEIHRRIFDAKGPAILFEKIKGSPFRAASNLYGTYERTDFLFRHTIESVKKVIEIKADPSRLLKKPLQYLGTPFTALKALPKKKRWNVPVKYQTTTIDQLPLIKSWPDDGGAFVTMPQVFTLGPGDKDIMRSNLGMYRIQLNGNDYELNKEIGLHYQLHRGIGVHHEAYNRSDEPFRASVFIGGPPAHAFSAIMPLPEGLSELTFAGMLAGRRFGYAIEDGHYLSADADFVISGTIVKGEKKREGPFGDHLGYYSIEHDFPYMKVDKVYHRKDAIWHFSVVGRPPMEDSSFGYLIHQLVKELTPGEFPGLVDIHAVDVAGVHPLLLALGKERYMPFREKQPEEILTIANRILGSGQTSLAKYLIIAAEDDDPGLDTHDIPAFFTHVLQRVNWRRDLHFMTKTTIDTLDYSGSGWNSGSKLIIACRGEVLRTLSSTIPPQMPDDYPFIHDVKISLPGILIVQGSKWRGYGVAVAEMGQLDLLFRKMDLSGLPLVVVVDDADFVAQPFDNFLWAVFTRSNPSHDVYGVEPYTEFKHWGCKGPLIIDARIKDHHAPELIVDAKVANRVDGYFGKGGALAGVV